MSGPLLIRFLQSSAGILEVQAVHLLTRQTLSDIPSHRRAVHDIGELVCHGNVLFVQLGSRYRACRRCFIVSVLLSDGSIGPVTLDINIVAAKLVYEIGLSNVVLRVGDSCTIASDHHYSIRFGSFCGSRSCPDDYAILYPEAASLDDTSGVDSDSLWLSQHNTRCGCYEPQPRWTRLVQYDVRHIEQQRNTGPEDEAGVK